MSSGKRCRWASDEYPVPKSSSASRTPSARSASSVSTVPVPFSMTALSVISSTSRRGGTPCSSSAARTVATRSGCCRWRTDRLTLHGTESAPSSSAQRRIARHTWRMTQLPIGTMRAGPLADVPVREGRAEAGPLGQRDELARRHEPPLGMLPADERLEGHDRLVADAHNRLHVDAQLVALDRAPQRALRRHPLAGVVAHRLVEDL